MLRTTILETVLIICEAQWNIEVITVSIELPLTLYIYEATTLKVEFCLSSLKHRRMFTDIDTPHTTLHRRVWQGFCTLFFSSESCLFTRSDWHAAILCLYTLSISPWIIQLLWDKSYNTSMWYFSVVRLNKIYLLMRKNSILLYMRHTYQKNIFLICIEYDSLSAVHLLYITILPFKSLHHTGDFLSLLRSHYFSKKQIYH